MHVLYIEERTGREVSNEVICNGVDIHNGSSRVKLGWGSAPLQYHITSLLIQCTFASFEWLTCILTMSSFKADIQQMARRKKAIA